MEACALLSPKALTERTAKPPSCSTDVGGGSVGALAVVLLLSRLLVSLAFARLFFSWALATSNKPKASSSVLAFRIWLESDVVDFDFLRSTGGLGFAAGGKEEALVHGVRWAPSGIWRL